MQRWGGRIVLAGLLAAVAGLPIQAEPIRRTWSHQWSFFDAESGLPDASVMYVVAGEDGVAWALTSRGPAWFDGYGWNKPSGCPEEILPDHSGAHPLSGGRLLFWTEGTLWIAHRARCTALRSLTPGPGHGVNSAVPDGNGGVYVESWDPERPDVHLAHVVAPEAADPAPRPVPWPAPPLSRPGGSLLRGERGGVFLRTRAGLYRRAMDGWSRVLEAPQGVHLRLLAEGPDGSLYAFTAYPYPLRGLWHRAPGAPATKVSLDRGAFLTALCVTRTGALVLAEDSGRLHLFEAGRGSRALRPPGGAGLHVRDLAVGKDGLIWMATDDGVIAVRLEGGRWSRWSAPPGPESWSRVHDLAPGPGGEVWMATDVGLVALDRGGNVRVLREGGRHLLAGATTVAWDHDDAVWVGSGQAFEGAYRRSGDRWALVGAGSAPASQRVHRIRVDSAGRVWLLTLGRPAPDGELHGGGVFVYEQGRLRDWGREHGLVPSPAYDFSESPDGEPCVGTQEGIVCLEGGRLRRWDETRGLRDSRVFTLAHDTRGRLWFSDQHGGVGYVDGSDPVYLAAAGNDARNRVWDFHVDARGWVWMSTESGLRVYHDDTLVDLFPEGESSVPLWPVLALGDTVYAGSLGSGLYAMHVGAADLTPPRIVVHEPRIAGSDAWIRVSVLPFGGRGPGDGSPIQVRLDGGPWSPWSERHAWLLEDLARGRHTLEVRGRSVLGHRSESPARLSFQVPGVWYRRPLFWGPLTLAAAACLVLAGLLAVRRHRAAQELARSHRRYEEVFDNTRALIFTHDPDGRLYAWNPAVRATLGLRARTTLPPSLLDLSEDGERDRLRRHLARAAAGDGPKNCKVRIRNLRGESVHLELETRLLAQPEGRASMVSIGRDVSDRERLQQDLAEAQKMEALGRLAGGIAHDFNNILTALEGYSALALERLPDDDPARPPIQRISQATRRASSLTRQLLAFSRRQVLQPMQLDLNDLLGELSEILKRLVGEHIRLEMQLCREPVWVLADPGQLQQVVLNLVLNARDAMPGGGRLRVESDRRVVTEAEPWTHETQGTIRNGAFAVLRVLDEGQGMDSTTRAKIFDPFFTTKPPGKGTGLGLSSVYGIVSQSGGFLRVRSRPDEGSCFEVFLPVVERSAPKESPAPEMSVSFRGGTVLLAEDDESVRLLLEEMLRRLGFAVVSAQDGAAARQAAEAMPRRPDLLVTDVIMPSLQGPQLAHLLRREFPDLPVLFISGYIGDEERLISEFPSARFIQKPFRVQDLVNAIRSLLEGAAASGEEEEAR